MTILCIEPDVILAELLHDLLSEKHSLVFATNGHHAVRRLEEQEVDLIISEHSFSTHNSFEFLYELRSYPEWQKLPFILFSSTYLSDGVQNSAAYRQLNISKYLYKPNTSLSELKTAVNRFELEHATS